MALEAHIHDNWVLRKGRIQASELFAVKANSVKASVVLQPGSMATNPDIQKRIGDKNNMGVIYIRWLSTRKPEAL